MSNSLALDDFLGHETRSGGSSQFFRGWRKRPGAAAHVFLHRKSNIIALWQHSLPRIYEKQMEDKSVQLRVFGGSWNCLESEDVLKKQYRRDRDTGERVAPPVICPTCRLMEHLVGLYQAGQIGFTEELFRWEGDDPQETHVLTYGGMLNLYSSEKYLSHTEKAEMSSAKVRLSEAWKENTFAKCNYLFCVVDADEPDQGVQIAIETTSLGDHVKECIRNQMVSLGENMGNPIKHPYAFRWEHHKNATAFDKKYKCIAMPRIPLTAEIEALIDGDPPDIAAVVKPGNVATLRAELETRYVGSVKLDWDDVFGPAERAGFSEPHTEPEPEPEPVAEPVKARATATRAAPSAAQKAAGEPAKVAAEPVKKSRRKKAEPEPEPEPIPGPLGEPCEECGASMAPTDTTCPACGAEYEVEAPEPEPPPPASPQAGKRGIRF